MTPDSAPLFQVLFVCTGNTCRSPLAEAVAKDWLARHGWTTVQVASAGIAANPGSGASPGSLQVARESGLDLTAHRSRQLTPELVAASDLILTMSPHHLDAVERLGGEGKSAVLGAFVQGGEGERTGPAVPDPFGSDFEVYRRTLETLREWVPASLRRLEPVLDP